MSRHNDKISNGLAGEVLSRLADFKETTIAFENDKTWTNLLGDTFQGLDTDPETIRNLLKLSKQIDVEISCRNEFGRKLASFIQNAPVLSLDKLTEFLNPNKLSQLKSIHNELGKTCLSKTKKDLEAQINCLRDCVKIWPKGKPGDLNFSELRELFNLAKELKLSEAEKVENSSLCNLIPNVSESALSSIEDTLRYLALISKSNNPKNRKELLFQANPETVHQIATAAASNIKNHCTNLIAQLSDFEKITRLMEFNFSSRSILDIKNQFCQFHSAIDDLNDWLRLKEQSNQLAENGLAEFVEKYASFKGDLPKIALCFEYVVLKSMLQIAFSAFSELGKLSGQTLSKARKEFSLKDHAMIRQNHQHLKNQLMNRRIDSGTSYGSRGNWTGGALIQLEIAKQKKHLPIRKLMNRAGKALQQLKPCFMMSPLSVSQFVPLDGIKFDVVIIDEASQMRPEDAIGAILRGKQVVVVGDPKQLPPTSFFDKENQSEDDDDDSIDTESILDLGLQQFGRPRRLLWHYRSRCARLIAFSNQQFYDDELMLFPSPGVNGSSLKSHYIAGRYQPTAGVNPIEAKAIAKAAAEFMLSNPKLSLGIVALNRAQRDMINDELELLMRENPKISEYQSQWENTIEPFIIKNLEMIQGDERDVIFISTVYGPDHKNCMYQRFGPINGKFGWRRLNVLFTRAKLGIEVFTSMHPSDVKVDNQSSRGVRALRDYLEYASTFQLPRGIATGKLPDSDFEISIASVLQSAGYSIEPQVGVSGFFIDIGVLDTKNNGQFLVGIECDGKTYHSSRSARDRDRLREEVLKKLGWRLIRVWSTDWFSNPRREAAKLLEQVRALECENQANIH